MNMDRKEALRLLRETPWTAPDGSEECSIGYFEPADAPRIARLFYAVYGEGYPVDTYYIPERLIEENARGAIRSGRMFSALAGTRAEALPSRPMCGTPTTSSAAPDMRHA